jgi:hypothetical protein
MTSKNTVSISQHSEWHNSIVDNDYKLFIVKNVVGYSFVDYNIHKIEYISNKDNIENTDQDIEYYFIIDILYDDAFAHWVYESAIYLPIFHLLKNKYPNLKLVLKQKKDYKLLFTDYFEIPQSDIIYNCDMKENNYSLFPSPISSLNFKSIDAFTEYTKIFEKFVAHFIQEDDDCESNNVIYDYVIMPRQKKENYYGNERSYDFDPIYEKVRNRTEKYKIFNTDSITNLRDQIKMLRMTNNVILVDGSAFLVNIMFCRKNINIHIIGHLTSHQIREFVKKLHIVNYFEKNKNLKFIRYESESKFYLS